MILSYDYKNKYAFTLAEVLITLGVIGILSAITIPSLIQIYQDIVLTNKLKKGYSQISQAWHQVVAEEPDTYTGRGGWTCTWPDGNKADYDVKDGRGSALMQKFKNIKKCTSTTECWADNYENYGDIFGAYGGRLKLNVWRTPDNMCISLSLLGSDDVHVALDTNCKQKPNRLGDDIFSILLGADGIVYFATDSKTTTDNPVTRGQVCPYAPDGFTVNGRKVNFRDRLLK